MHGTWFAEQRVRCARKALMELAKGDLCNCFVSYLIISSTIPGTAEACLPHHKKYQ